MNWIKEKQERFNKLSEYVNDLESQRNFLLKALSEQAAGLVLKSCSDDWDYATKLKYTAADNLAKMHKIYPIGKKPSLWW
jgi:hypothetical protein